MALITKKAIVLLLVIGFVQIVHLQARHTEYVFGPRQHLDSGQDFGDPIQQDIEEQQEAPLQNSFISEGGILNNRDALIQTFQKFLEENEEGYLYVDDDDRLDFNDFDDFDDNEKEHYDIFDETDDDYSYNYQVPLKRVRRRIIPIGGGALDRSRSDRNGPYERSRSPWGQAPKNRDGFSRRSGPTGSAALFSLFPDLAPADWKANNPKKKKAGQKERDVESIKNKKGASSKKDKQEEKSQKDEPSTPDSSANQKRRVQKKKTKISKKEKEEIAKFAESHGIEKAISHFKSRVNAPLRANAVEKFLRRYKNRMQRKANRS